MKLYATVTSERDNRPARKGGNEFITLSLSNKGINVFDLVFKGDKDNRGTIEVMSYYDAKKTVINYDGTKE